MSSIWTEFFNQMTIDNSVSELSPISERELSTFELSHTFKLPFSYREFCMNIGAGVLANVYSLSVPKIYHTSSMYSLDDVNTFGHELEYKSYAKNPDQIERSLFFASDTYKSFYFFDPQDVTDRERNEYAVYTLWWDYTVDRTADNFKYFVMDFCFRTECEKISIDEPLTKIFMPIT